MPTRHRAACSLIVCAWLASVASGCHSLPDGGFSHVVRLFSWDDDVQREQECRTRYLQDGDPKALRWLLANRVRQGMDLVEVGSVLGQPGEREHSDNWIKSGSASYRAGDSAYRWGPDSSGHTVYLVFRDGKLVDYDPRDFAD